MTVESLAVLCCIIVSLFLTFSKIAHIHGKESLNYHLLANCCIEQNLQYENILFLMNIIMIVVVIVDDGLI